MPVESPLARRAGRPRSEEADNAIIEATLDLLTEEAGVDAVSMEAVAARAKVGKATIYRRWHSKEALIADALGALKAPPPQPSGASVRDDLINYARGTCAAIMQPRLLGLFWIVHSCATKYPELAREYDERIVEPRRETVREILRRGVESGELRADLDIEMIVRMLAGTAQAWSREPGSLPDDLAVRIVDQILLGARAYEEPAEAD